MTPSRGGRETTPYSISRLPLWGILAVIVAVAAAGLATSDSFGSGALVRLRQELGRTAESLLKTWNMSLGLSSQWHRRNESYQSANDTPCSCGVRRLSGVVDDCCCEFETVDSLNRHVLQPILESLVKKPFFRYFKVRLWCDCPFWREEGMCHSRDCSVGECPEEEVPLQLKNNKHGVSLPEPSASAGAEGSGAAAESGTSASASSLSAVDRTLNSAEFQSWAEEDNPWTHDNEADDGESSYVNLVLNPERYTGYKGDSARRIWSAIYQESCFQDGPNDTCRERRVFYRLISGFHMSITVHVSTSFLHDGKAGEWGPHLEMFKWRVASQPDRLANLYFTFLFVLRAAMKASDYLSFVSYDTGNPKEDVETAELVRSLVASERLKSACPVPFDEASLWTGDEGPQLFNTLQQHFRNISAIMDCVGCERCRLWGKLEILGLATALKILFAEEKPQQQRQGTKCPIVLQRNEVTALVNTLWRFSEALKSTVEMMTLLEQAPPAPQISSLEDSNLPQAQTTH